MIVRPNRRGVQEFLRSREVQEGLHRLGEKVADEFQDRAPVVTGQMRDSVRVEVDVTAGVARAHVIVGVPYARRVLSRNPALIQALNAVV